MIAPLLDLISVMAPRERRRLWIVMAGITAAALIDVLGVASVMPFLALVADPAAAERMPALASIRAWLGISDARQFTLVMGLVALGVILLNSGLNAALTWAQLLFSNLVGFSLSRRLLRRYLARDRLFFAHRNSAELSKNILNEVDRVVSGVLSPSLILVSRAFAATAIVILLLVIEPWLAVLLAAGFGGIYVLIYLFMRNRLNRLGQTAVRGNEQRFQVVAESFATLDELKLYGRVAAFARRYDAPGRAFARANALSMVISQTPRFLLEPLAFGSIVVIVLFALWSGGNIAAVLPVAGLFAYAGYRLMPAFQNIFVAVSSIRFYRPAVRIVVDAVGGEDEPLLQDERTSAPIPFSRAIELRDISIALSDSGRATLRSISLDIQAHTTVGLVGKTGCGKSTLVGVITGLLRPTSGTVSIDGRLLDEESLPGWQRHIGYVPQEIVLTDDTVSANIALGVPEERIDQKAVERAARIAGIHDFIVAELPGGYDGRVGERGARISGGQRQRIGIARALYHDPDVIVFDEATSALDNETEQAVMKAIEELAGTRTIIMIAHRLTTLRRADVIHLMDEGRVIASGRLADIAPRLGDAVA